MNAYTPRKRSIRSYKKVLLWLSGGFALLVLVAVALLFADRSKAESALAEKLAELEAAGIPTTLDEVNRRYHEHGRDPEGNAALLYEEAFARKIVDDAARGELSEAIHPGNEDQPLEAETLQVIANLVLANRDAIQLLKEAAAKPYLRRDLDFRQAPLAIPPDIGKIRESGRLLAGEEGKTVEGREVYPWEIRGAGSQVGLMDWQSPFIRITKTESFLIELRGPVRKLKITFSYECLSRNKYYANSTIHIA